MDITAARAALAAQRAAWNHSIAEIPNPRPTPTRAETQLIAAGAALTLKAMDGSRVDPAALDPLDPSVPPIAPPWIPTIVGEPVCGSTLTALPGLVRPRRIFCWLRNEQPIIGANTLRYVPVVEDLGAKISFRATRAHEVATSAQVGPIRRPASWPSDADPAVE